VLQNLFWVSLWTIRVNLYQTNLLISIYIWAISVAEDTNAHFIVRYLSSLYNFSCDFFWAGRMSTWLNSQAFRHLEHVTWNLQPDIPSHQAHNSWYVYGSRTSHTGGAHITMLCAFSLVLYMGWSLGQSFGVLAHKGTLLFPSSIFYCTAILEHEFHCHPCKRKTTDRQTDRQTGSEV
jgi:hypothetical protein